MVGKCGNFSLIERSRCSTEGVIYKKIGVTSLKREKSYKEVNLEIEKEDFLRKIVILAGSVKYLFRFIVVNFK